MSFDHLYIRDVEGERRLEAAALPLRIGTGSDCGLRLPGPGGGPVLLLDILDGAPFVQPVGRDSSFAINGEALVASRRLRDGDELQFYGSRIRVAMSEEKLGLSVQLEDSAYVTQPPEIAGVDGAAADEAIAPTVFKRAEKTGAAKPESTRSPLKVVLIGGLVILSIASWLLFTAKSVQILVGAATPDAV